MLFIVHLWKEGCSYPLLTARTYSFHIISNILHWAKCLYFTVQIRHHIFLASQCINFLRHTCIPSPFTYLGYPFKGSGLYTELYHCVCLAYHSEVKAYQFLAVNYCYVKLSSQSATCDQLLHLPFTVVLVIISLVITLCATVIKHTS